MAIDDNDLHKITEAFKGALAANVPPETHHAHHLYITDLIERKRRREETIENLKGQLALWGITGIIGSLFAAFLYAVTNGWHQ